MVLGIEYEAIMNTDNTDIVPDDTKTLPIMIIGIASACVFLLSAFGSYFFLFKDKSPKPDEANYHGEEKNHPDRNEKESNSGSDSKNEKYIADLKSNERSVYYILDPLTVSLGLEASASHLRVGISLEVAESDYGKIEHYELKIQDVLVTYLRAVTERDLRDPASMARIRAQMLRRLRLITHDTHIRALLITEYLIN